MKKLMLMLLTLGMLSGCGKDTTTPQIAVSHGPQVISHDCTVIQATNGAIIKCPDGSIANVSDAVNLLTHTMPATSDQCPAGGTDLIISFDSAYTGVWSSLQKVSSAFTVCNGATGEAGVNAMPMTIVQFCPGVTTYPTEFNEVGFKMGKDIYAVYSANDGFMTKLSPGYYNSNAVGSNCNFTVNADGSISN